MAAYDVVIVGAGPAGLSLAVELAEYSRVLVLEREPFGHTATTWYSYGDRVRDHGLDDAVAFRTDRLVFVSPNHKHEMLDDCVVLDHGRVLDIWLERARARGGRARPRGVPRPRRRRRRRHRPDQRRRISRPAPGRLHRPALAHRRRQRPHRPQGRLGPGGRAGPPARR